MNKKLIMVAFAVMLIASIGTAAVVSYLSNTATVSVTVDSPMSIQFAEVPVANEVTVGALADSGSPWVNDLVLAGITGLDTVDVGVKVVNLSEVQMQNKTLLVTVSNGLGNVGLGDITSLQFFDTGASVASGNRVWQELSGLAVQSGNDVTYSIPINSLASGTVYKYPVTVTFGNVAPAVYSITAVLNT